KPETRSEHVKDAKRRLTLAAALTASIAAGGCGGGGNDGGNETAVCGETTDALGGQTAPRLLLSRKLLATLRTRAQSKDPAWTELAGACESWANAPVNPPSGAAYGPKPTVASGYYGDGYVAPLLSLGVCYRTLLGIDDAAAAKYGAQGAKILE